MKIASTFVLCALLLLAGCDATSRQYGDAQVTRISLKRPWVIAPEGYELSLPAVSLTKRGTTEFQVFGLPTDGQSAGYSYFLELDGVPLDPADHSFANASYRYARVAIQFLASDGTALFRGEARLGSLRWLPWQSVMRNDTFLGPAYQAMPLLSSATTYRVRLTVLKPSKASTDRLCITGVYLQ